MKPVKDIGKIIAQNKERLRKLLEPYDPITGQGSYTDRFKFRIMKEVDVMIPLTMLNIPYISEAHRSGDQDNTGSLAKFYVDACKKQKKVPSKKGFAELIEMFNEDRLDHDFEYWAYTCWFITDKDTGEVVPFKLNRPQRLLEAIVERERLAKRPIRIIIVKMRQWGGSTYIQAKFAWIQNRLKTGWGSVIITQVNNQARNVRAMYTKAAKLYPAKHGTITLIPFEGSTNTKYVKERDCVIDISSNETPDNTRSFDYALCHLSEVGLWKGTLTKKPEDLIQNIRSGIKKVPMSMIALESTAKGVGNFFHKEFLAAVKGDSEYVPVFMAWYTFEKYTLNIGEENYEEFIKSMTDDDYARWLQGATLEGIKWYNYYQKAENLDRWRMESEFPGSAEEAFQSTGQLVFHRRDIELLALNCTLPEAKGDIVGKTAKYEEAFHDLSFEKMIGGNLWIWEYPDKSIKVKNRYIVSVDIGGRTAKADYSVIRVFDRYWMLDGGKPQAVATWHGHLEQDLVAWKAAQIAYWYNKALLVVEWNSLKKDHKNTEGTHYLTVLDEIAPYYENIYAGKPINTTVENPPRIYGFRTNALSKDMAVSNMNAMLRDMLYVEVDVRCTDEMKSFERKPDGTIGAVDGSKDDIIMATIIGLYVSEKDMDMPVEVIEKPKVRRKVETNQMSNF